MTQTISSLGLMTQSILQIQNVQSQLSGLSIQLATGKESLDLSDYSLSESNRILDLRSLMTKKQSFIDCINKVEPQLKVYDKSFDELDKVANQARALVNQTQNLSQSSGVAVSSQISGMLDQVQYFLNQKLGDRFIFGGARFGVQPVANLNGLAAPTNTTIVATPTLPEYDSAAPGADATSYTASSVKIDDSFSVTYGISSNNAAFQNLILGLRWAYKATQETTDAAYATDMDNARSLLDTGITAMRTLHGQVASNLSQFESTKQVQTSFLSEAQGQIDDIQTADPAKVSAQISFTQAQLQASYSVTAKIASLSLVNYLSS